MTMWRNLTAERQRDQLLRALRRLADAGVLHVSCGEAYERDRRSLGRADLDARIAADALLKTIDAEIADGVR